MTSPRATKTALNEQFARIGKALASPRRIELLDLLTQGEHSVERLPAEDQEQIGRTLLSHVEKLRALRAEIDKGIRSLDAGQGRESSAAPTAPGRDACRRRSGSRRR